MVRTADSDVLVILITFMPQLQEYCRHTKIWVDFGTANSKRMIFVNDCCNHLDELISLGLTFFHFLFGCDSTASFYRKSKNILFEAWMSFPMYGELTAAFQSLSWQPTHDTITDCQFVIQQYISYVYSKRLQDLDELRFNLFKSSSSNSSNNPLNCI